ncbi:MAG TPA: phosphoenolpyruvate--protein phosphotransferase [Burkholderiales bacterium]|nr:phosphoenolpyruvate--protein phosphotransferase [Burkholderiales bacterium]
MVPSWRQIVREVNAAASLHDALTLIVHRVKESLPVDACAVYLTDLGTEQYVLMAFDGLDAAPAGTVRVGRKGLTGLVAERRELVVVTNAAAHQSYRSSPEPGQESHGSFLGMPLIHHRAVLGVLVAWKRVHVDFGNEEVIFFLTIAAHLARVIHGASATDEVRRMLSGEIETEAFVQGIQAAAGVAIGTAATLGSTVRLESVPDRRADDTNAEETLFRAAVADVQKELGATRDRLAPLLTKDVRALFDVYILLLGNDGLVSDTVDRIRAGSWAPGAWRDAIVAHARVFEQLEDPYLRARGDDIYEIGQRVLVRLRPEQRESKDFPEHCILVGDTVGVTEIAAVPIGRLAGIVCMRGSTLSHTAVLARSLGIPAVVSVASLPTGRLDGCEMVVDGYEGRIYVKPSHRVLEAYRQRARDEDALSERLTALRHIQAETPDGVRLPLYANIGLLSDIAAAQRSGAEGVGLYRSEYPFLLREAFPIEDEQYEIYRKLLESFPQQPVTMRTLDVGGDKLLSYFPVQEDNPFLGCRGIRFSLDHPEIFLIQLRAMLRANAGLNNLEVLLPMIGTVGEVDESLGLLARAHRELSEAGVTSSRPRVGVMIEVPAAVYLTSALAERADFFSIGTNDLTQYMLAADRNNAQVTTPYDSLHPAILDAIGHVIEAAHLKGKPVSVCGEMAGDPAGALLLLGMGVDALSMSPMSVPRVKLTIRSFTLQRARALADVARSKEDGFAIHRLLNGALEETGV